MKGHLWELLDYQCSMQKAFKSIQKEPANGSDGCFACYGHWWLAREDVGPDEVDKDHIPW
jgi:hypothetical protein